MSNPISDQLLAIHGHPGVSWLALDRIVRSGLYRIPRSNWSSQKLTSAGIPSDRADMILSRPWETDVNRQAQVLQHIGARVMTVADPEYPRLLTEIAKPPPILYSRGNLRVLQQSCLAVVGTRHPSPYGEAVVRHLLEPVIRAGIPIVSGLAQGIDGIAHRLAIRLKVPTVAVLGTGIDLTYPWSHHQLVKDILAGGGAILSEFPIGAGPERHHFPQRNRIISGLSRAVLLVEAGTRSGALITAKFAVDQNREVMAVPGSILSPQSEGVLSWLKLGAKPVTTAADILEYFGRQVAPQTAAPIPPPLSPDMAAIWPWLTHQPIHIDVLVEKSRLDTSRVTATLALMEIQGTVRHLGGMYYSLTTA